MTMWAHVTLLDGQKCDIFAEVTVHNGVGFYVQTRTFVVLGQPMWDVSTIYELPEGEDTLPRHLRPRYVKEVLLQQRK